MNCNFDVLRCRLAAMLALAAATVGCGGAATDEQGRTAVESLPLAADLAGQQVLSTAEYLAQARYRHTNPENGASKAQICRACHSMEVGGANMIGPNLNGIFGSAAGTATGFDYSEALRDAGFVWTPRALDAWLAQPTKFLPGNRMSMVGITDENDRNDIIAYLLTTTEEQESKDERAISRE